ncbi:hypothetical protein FB45DRAFT_449624 [Roridomyces roridus]|uniref:F-box domain-containing protein n=1 Tax=Roridomyces roridus TaxID=1738132 RepID=A0AAD7C3H4_9AGAR|nr:hypothetical protein FB45DRAFT_449624 [Roridomyces roridus]
MSGAHRRVPTELWNEILDTFPLYPGSDDLKNFALVCRSFLPIARSFLFSDLHLAPFLIHSDRVLLPPSNVVDSRLERIDFCCSPEIAPLVQCFTIFPDRRLSIKAPDPSEWAESETPDVLLDALFERLDRFTGLRKLVIRYIQFTQSRVDIIRHLPNLRQLDVVRCPAVPEQLISVPPRSLSITTLKLWHNDDTLADNFWYDYVQPDQLRVIEADFRHGGALSITQIPIFPHVQKLWVSMGENQPSYYHAILSKFPAVRSVRVVSQGPETNNIRTSAILPALEEYYGGIQPLPLFLAAESLHRVQISSVRPEHLIARFHGGLGGRITALNVDLTMLSIQIFRDLVEQLPELRELLIRHRTKLRVMFTEKISYKRIPPDLVLDGRAQGYYKVRAGFKPSEFFLALANVPFLPPTLERLVILYDYLPSLGSFSFDIPCGYTVSDFPKMRDDLVARCPGLNYLWLHGIYFRYAWRDGGNEFSARNYMDSYVQFAEPFYDDPRWKSDL